MNLDDVADELYGLPPHEFIAARDERAATARNDGDARLSATIKKLRKPTVSAWLANLLVRERPRDIDELIALGTDLRAAQNELAGDRLRQLSRRRHTMVAALAKEGEALGRRAGVSVSDAAVDELTGSLEAALADSDGAAALRSGRLTAAIHHADSGLGEGWPSPALGTDAGAPPAPGSRRSRPAGTFRGAAVGRNCRRNGDTATVRSEGPGRGAPSRARRATGALDRLASEQSRLEREVGDLESRLQAAGHDLRHTEAEAETTRERLDGLRTRGG